MKSKDEFENDLHWFYKEFGASADLIIDGSSYQQNPSFKRLCDQVGIVLGILEHSTTWSTRAELCIGLLKEEVRNDTRESNYLMVLWDYAIECRVLTHNAVPLPLFKEQGKNNP